MSPFVSLSHPINPGLIDSKSSTRLAIQLTNLDNVICARSEAQWEVKVYAQGCWCPHESCRQLRGGAILSLMTDRKHIHVRVVLIEAAQMFTHVPSFENGSEHLGFYMPRVLAVDHLHTPLNNRKNRNKTEHLDKRRENVGEIYSTNVLAFHVSVVVSELIL